MKKIEALTPAQEKAMLTYRDEWLAIGRSTASADRPAAEAAITALYAALPEPQLQPRFWWVDGPAVGSLVRTLLTQKGANLRDNLGDNLRDNLDWEFWGQHEAAWPAFYNWPNAELRTMYSEDKASLLSHWLSLEVGGRMLLLLEKSATVTHEEHGPIKLAPGIWEIGRVREYDPFLDMTRQVVD